VRLRLRLHPLCASPRSIFLAPIRTPLLEERSANLRETLSQWASFAEYMRDEHGIAIECLNQAYKEEHRAYFLRTAQWKSLPAQAQVGDACAWYSFDVGTVTIDELKTKARGPFACTVRSPGAVQALAGWFDVTFDGSPSAPAETPVVLSTSPSQGYTHWGQQVFLLGAQLFAEPGDVILGEGALTRQPHNPRTLHMDVSYAIRRQQPAPAAEQPRKIRYAID
jgi:protein arginine N-methyltransferase 1